MSQDEVAGDFSDRWAENPDGLIYEPVNGPTFKGYVLLIKSPSRVKVGLASDNFTRGARIFEVADKYNAAAAINGGEFEDIGGMGDGATPIGLLHIRSGNASGTTERPGHSSDLTPMTKWWSLIP